MAKTKTRRFDYDFGLRKKIPTILVRSKFEHDVDGDGSIFRIGIARKDFATLDKSKILIQLCLQKSLMVSRIGPIKMVTYSEHDVSGLLIRAYHVDDVSLLDRYGTCPIMRLHVQAGADVCFWIERMTMGPSAA